MDSRVEGKPKRSRRQRDEAILMTSGSLLLVLGVAAAMQPPYGTMVFAALALGGIIAGLVFAVRQVHGRMRRVAVGVALAIIVTVAIMFGGLLLLAQGIAELAPFILM